MNILQNIVRDHFDSVAKSGLNIRPAVFNNVYRMLRCGDIHKGYTLYGCEDCGKFHAVPFTCKSRFCTSCGNLYSSKRATNISFKLVNSTHRHCVFTIPEELRIFFRRNRNLLNCLFEAVNDTIIYFFHNLNKSENFTPGFICVLHTFGRSLQWNPALYFLGRHTFLWYAYHLSTSLLVRHPDSEQFPSIEHSFALTDTNLKLAAKLCSNDLFPLFEYQRIGNMNGITRQDHIVNTYIYNNSLNFTIKRITQKDIHEIREIHKLLEKFDSEKFIYISKALSDFDKLEEIPYKSPFYILSLFSILETLLVKKQTPSRVTYQLKTKLDCLKNKVESNLSYTSDFGDVGFKSLIAKLYEFRSDIAHGDFLDFEEDLQMLISTPKVSEVLHKILKDVLIHSLKEPRLILQLKFSCVN